MKSIVLGLWLLAPIAHADLVCEARELVAGNTGRSGSITLGQDPFSVQWDGDETGLMTDTDFCGIKKSADIQCETTDNSFGPTHSLVFTCIDNSIGEVNKKVAEGYFVRSEVNNVGRYSCSGKDVRQTIEFNSCR